jgi:hypothetical protein
MKSCKSKQVDWWCLFDLSCVAGGGGGFGFGLTD